MSYHVQNKEKSPVKITKWTVKYGHSETTYQKLRPRSHPMPLSYIQKYNQNDIYTDIYCQFIRSIYLTFQ